tara:strand:- start:33877 stop:34842 length:966 start_codon:yes stop_codon:yes gene_type:complete
MTMTDAASSRRIDWIDIARGVALIAMAIYHFSWDLGYFGYIDPAAASSGPLKWFARSIASSFLFLVGISLILAHVNGIRWKGYGRRLAMIVASALAITVATRLFTPDAYVFFGILHQIAFASVVGLAFLRLPSPVLFAIAAAWLSVPFWGKSMLFDAPWLTWLGLSPFPPRSNDFVPVFPWFAAVLTGMGVGRLLIKTNATDRLRAHPPGRNLVSTALRFLGRHSLATYLLHQPILIACVYLFSLVILPDQGASFVRSCVATCSAQYEANKCEAFCGCALSKLQENGLLEGVFKGELSQSNDPRVAELTDACSIEAFSDDK